MLKRATVLKNSSPKAPTTRTKRSNPASARNPEATLSAPTLTYEEIAARAYALFLSRGGQPGDDLADWFRAEAELRREKGIEGRLPE